MLIGLQYLRAFAAIIVVFFHLIISGVFHDRWFNEYPGLIQIGNLGVDVFFVLSGFIITYSIYHKKEIVSKRKFLLLRIIRIYPMYWFYTLLLLLIFLSPVTKSFSFDLLYTFKSMLLFPTYNAEGELYPLLIVGWTLVCEMYFYLIFCVNKSSNKWKSLIGVCVTFIVILIIAKFFLTNSAITAFLAQPIFFEFVIGMLLYNLYSHQRGYYLINKAKYLIRVIAVATFIILLFYWKELGLYRGILSANFATFALLSAISIPSKEGNIISRFFILVGDASYSLYLSHIIFVMFITGLWKRNILLPVHGFEFVYFTFCIILCIVFSIISYLFLEKKINRAGSIWAKKYLK
jgi:exopolysaccharide production protein ExoZ